MNDFGPDPDAEIEKKLIEAAPESTEKAAKEAYWALNYALFGDIPKERNLGRYQLRRKIGQGAMGAVYEAWDQTLERIVALKLLHEDAPDLSEDEHKRLWDEARTMAKIKHPNVVTIYDVGENEGIIFLSMELASGGNLRTWLTKEQRLPQQILEKFLEAGEGLFAAHRAGIVHRDFKPDNVVLDTNHVAKVSDFGLGRKLIRDTQQASDARSATPDAQGSLLGTKPAGTPRYMAPEQWLGSAVDERADQYAFSVALYEALFGCLPSERSTEGSFRAYELRLQHILKRGCQEQPEQRYPSLGVLLSELRQAKRNYLRLGIPLVVVVVIFGLLVPKGIATYRNHKRKQVSSQPSAALAKLQKPLREGSRRVLAAIGDPPRLPASELFVPTKQIDDKKVAAVVESIRDVNGPCKTMEPIQVFEDNHALFQAACRDGNLMVDLIVAQKPPYKAERLSFHTNPIGISLESKVEGRLQTLIAAINSKGASLQAADFSEEMLKFRPLADQKAWFGEIGNNLGQCSKYSITLSTKQKGDIRLFCYGGNVRVAWRIAPTEPYPITYLLILKE
jgi:serine/threonine protein kinase